MTLESKLAEIKQIGLLALKDLSDVEIAKEMNIKVSTVTEIRKSLGIFHTLRINIFEGWKKIYDHGNILQFTIPNVEKEEIGIDQKKEYEFTAKNLGKKKIELTLRERTE